jgi:hypothetical protein
MRTGQIIKHAYMGLCFSYIVQDKFGIATEYVNIQNPEFALSLGSKHVLAEVTNGRAKVLGLDPEADLEKVNS